jgi:hypothetical protein
MEGLGVDAGSDTGVINVRRQWSDWRMATYRRTDVSDLHWRVVGGGVNALLPAPFVHGRVLCDAMISGELAHSCSHGPPPHDILVCVLKKDNLKLWPEIEREIGPRPGTKKRLAWENTKKESAHNGDHAK